MKIIIGEENGNDYMPPYWNRVPADPTIEDMQSVICNTVPERPPIDFARISKDKVFSSPLILLCFHYMKQFEFEVSTQNFRCLYPFFQFSISL